MKNEREVHVDVKDGDAEPKVEKTPDEQAEEVAAQVAEEARGKGSSVPPDVALEELSKKAKEYEDRFLRTAAEFENYKKRMARQYDDVVRTANDRLLLDLLEVVDNFERALLHDEKENNSGSLRQGTEMIYNQLQSLLARYGVTPIEAVGKEFDANLHEALMEVPSNEHAAGRIALEVTRGYKQSDRVLRHSKVGVSKGPAEDTANDSAEE